MPSRARRFARANRLRAKCVRTPAAPRDNARGGPRRRARRATAGSRRRAQKSAGSRRRAPRRGPRERSDAHCCPGGGTDRSCSSRRNPESHPAVKGMR